MYPHERSLVKRLEGKPFALLGVNSDTKDRVRQAMKKENITWRSWWDGGNTEGHGKYGQYGCAHIFLEHAETESYIGKQISHITLLRTGCPLLIACRKAQRTDRLSN